MKTFDTPLDILLAVSNEVIREGLRRILQAHSLPMRVVSTTENLEGFEPELILFDINQPIQALSAAYPRAKPVLLDNGVAERDINYLLMCHRIRGVIGPEDSVEMFYKALKVVRAGEIWIDQKHLKSLLGSAGTLTPVAEIKGLSDQDKRIVGMIARGLKNREIADRLCLSEHTIKSHVSRIYKKLKVKNRAQLASLARDNRFAAMGLDP